MRMFAIGIVLGVAMACTVGGGDGENQLSLAGQPAEVDWSAVEEAIGRPGIPQAGDVYRFNFPRSDMRVMVGDIQVRPALALGGWVAFKPVASGAMIAGDLVLAEEEVAPVVGALQAGGVEQTAIHHHILGESPRVVYVHVHAVGDPVALARTIQAAVATTRIPAPPGASAAAAGGELALDTARIAAVMGHSGRVNGGVYQLSIPRAETILDYGVEIPPTMGLGTVINFQPVGGGRAAITGDYVLTASEVNPVIRALVDSGIAVTSLHSHMLTEEPRLFFMHFWAVDDGEKLARGLKAALDRTNSR